MNERATASRRHSPRVPTQTARPLARFEEKPVIGYIAYLTAQQVSADRAREALPDAPVAPPPIDRPVAARRARLTVSQLLRSLADRIAPAPQDCGAPCDVANPA
jgi:hypothetical protein